MTLSKLVSLKLKPPNHLDHEEMEYLDEKERERGWEGGREREKEGPGRDEGLMNAWMNESIMPP